jgi:hypothetical protein
MTITHKLKGVTEMKSNNQESDVDAKILCIIKRESDKYFNDFFASHKDSVKTFADVKKLTGSLLDSQLDIAILDALSADCIKLMVSVDRKPYPVLHAAVAEWKSGVFFKKTYKGIFFVWNSAVKGLENALLLSEFNDLLESKGLGLASDINCVGAAESNVEVDEVNRKLADGQPLSFVNTDAWQACNVNYDLLSASYDDANKSLVLDVENRLFT